jgi:hypothetical protein
VKKAAKERLVELIDPAIAALDKVLRDPESEDAVKVRAATAILDRTGFRPGIVVEVSPDDAWGALLNDAWDTPDDRSLGMSRKPPELESGIQGQADYEARERARHEQEDRDDAERRSTHLDNLGHDVFVVPRGSSGPGPFANPNRRPSDPRSEHDPSPVGQGAKTREQLLVERLSDEPDNDSWTSARRPSRYPTPRP